MRANHVQQTWEQGGSVVTAWLNVGNSYVAELMAHEAFDCLTVDMQHGVVGYEDAVVMLQAISTTGKTPFVRVPWNDPAIIMKVLDAGAYGIICPMVNSKAEAEAFVGACRYAPQGYRSFGPNRALLYAGNDYFTHANDTVVTMAMIETAEAVENLEEILAVPGLDAIYVGPADLSISLTGQRSGDYTDPELVAVLDHILVTAQKFGIRAGLHTGSPEYALKMFEKGFQFAAIQSAASYMATEAKRVLAVTGRTGSEQKRQVGPY
ncbi:MAG: 2,4-dihydroxyhept-2-ene-1,7-dioic acid aldolase [Caldilineaceae bacterium]|nr:2,4-dihydroxyhept-2-ene-1,7-dioic acid aldolase [Caldilineaceae bacterium]